MATTYELIASQTLGSDTASVTFSSIPQTYDDLVLVMSARSDRAGAAADDHIIEFNGSSANYSARYLTGSGSAATSATDTVIYGTCPASTSTSNTFGSGEFYVPNYAGSSYKSVSGVGLRETNATAAYMHIVAGLWSNTAAITQIDLSLYFGNYVTGSSFYLYGVTHA